MVSPGMLRTRRNEDIGCHPCDASDPLVVFHLADRRYALPLSAVDRILPMVDITPLPRAPAMVLGVIDLAGRVVPVLDLRRRFRLPPKETALTDQLVIARAKSREVALVVDSVAGVSELRDTGIVNATDLVPVEGCMDGVMRLEDGLVVVHDLATFLSAREREVLDRALDGGS